MSCDHSSFGSAMPVVNPALFVVAPLVFSKLGYDPDADFAPVSLITTYQFCVSVPPASSIKNVKGLVEWIKQNPNQANYGSFTGGGEAGGGGGRFAALPARTRRSAFAGMPVSKIRTQRRADLKTLMRPRSKVFRCFIFFSWHTARWSRCLADSAG